MISLCHIVLLRRTCTLGYICLGTFAFDSDHLLLGIQIVATRSPSTNRRLSPFDRAKLTWCAFNLDPALRRGRKYIRQDYTVDLLSNVIFLPTKSFYCFFLCSLFHLRISFPHKVATLRVTRKPPCYFSHWPKRTKSSVGHAFDASRRLPLFRSRAPDSHSEFLLSSRKDSHVERHSRYSSIRQPPSLITVDFRPSSERFFLSRWFRDFLRSVYRKSCNRSAQITSHFQKVFINLISEKGRNYWLSDWE